jgi:hypothetical protein
MPITGICCACSSIGHASAALPNAAMKSRRLMAPPGSVESILSTELADTGLPQSHPRLAASKACSPNGGLIMPGSAAGRLYGDLIITLAARHKLPTV